MGFFLKGVCFQKATSLSYFISLFAMFESRLLSVFSEYQKNGWSKPNNEDLFTIVEKVAAWGVSIFIRDRKASH